MQPFHIQLTGEAVFALSCAAGILAPFLIKFVEPAPPGLPSTTSAAKHRPRLDDPATVALVVYLKARR